MESRIINKIAGIVVAAALVVVGLGFIVLGLSLFPLIGILVGMTLITFALNFLELEAACEKCAIRCTWPPTSAEARAARLLMGGF